ncbi:hypothetical protein MPL3356_390186 [Mesorhizobium plurifarium]|uniref:Uncharacterized protein n=1 Tax=Mesorhizobium plurifarium TaxID=69974 RepID=A0A090DYL5_MESPL|nr:hypothetical protein MPL3356_390186 [Mesorhizobium plurifarium]
MGNRDGPGGALVALHGKSGLRQQAGDLGSLAQRLAGLHRTAQAVERVAADAARRAPGAVARLSGPALVQAFHRFEAARNLAVAVWLEIDHDRLGKPDIVHHFLRSYDRLLSKQSAPDGARCGSAIADPRVNQPPGVRFRRISRLGHPGKRVSD